MFSRAPHRIQFRNSWDYHDRAALGKCLASNNASGYVMGCHSFTQKVEAEVSFDTTERTRGHAEEVGRNGNAADFIRDATGSNFACDKGLSWVSPDFRLSFFSGKFRHNCILQAVTSTFVVVWIFRSVIWHYLASKSSASHPGNVKISVSVRRPC
jgi:hypothetical protein